MTFSTSLSGLKKQLDGHYFHRLDTAELMYITPKQMSDELKLAIYHIQIPRRLISMEKPGKDSYSWKQRFAYAQLKSIVSFILQTMLVASLDQEIEQYKHSKEGSWSFEHREGLIDFRSSIKGEYGNILVMDRYQPKTQRPEIPEKEVPCFACSL